MRIVAGDLRGRPIATPPGLETRPTSDRARQAIFNILEHAPWSPGVQGRQVMDLFAGSGAMGLEALSRGAASCLFVEQAAGAGAVITGNIAAFKLGERAHVLRRDATALGMRPPTQPAADLAFLDPPYGQGLGLRALQTLRQGGWLTASALVVLEQGAVEPALTSPGFKLEDERRYGAAKVIILSADTAPPGEDRVPG